MLCLSEQDIVQAVDCKEVIDAIENSLVIYEEKKFHMPNRMHVDYDEDTLLLMPCFIPKRFGTKLVSVFPGNAQKGLPVVNGVVVLNDGI